MKAAILTAYNEPLTLADVQFTHAKPCFGQVEVRMICSGICGAQLQEIAGSKKGGMLPHLLGHEGAGIVERIGEGVSTVKPGDKVCLHWRKGDGAQSKLPIYVGEKCGPVGAGAVTTFNEMAIISENRCTAVPADVPDELCALLGCGLSTALGTIETEANLLMGESILIIGCGGLGLNLILAAKLRQAGIIWSMDIVNRKELRAMTMGADCFRDTLRGPMRFDVIVDTSGNPDVIGGGMEHLAPSGRMILVGQPKEFEQIMLFGKDMFEGEGKTIKATQGGGFNPSKDIPRYVNLWRTGAIDVNKIITHRVKLDEINAGVDLVRQGEAGRVLVEMQ